MHISDISNQSIDQAVLLFPLDSREDRFDDGHGHGRLAFLCCFWKAVGVQAMAGKGCKNGGKNVYDCGGKNEVTKMAGKDIHYS